MNEFKIEERISNKEIIDKNPYLNKNLIGKVMITIRNNLKAIRERKKLHKNIGLYDESYLILSDAKFIISCYLKKYNFKYLDFTSSTIGNNGISSNKKKLVYLELFRLINELEISKIFNLIILNLRLIKSLF